MFIYQTQDEIIDDFIAGFSDCTLSLPEQKAFMEVMDCNPAINKHARAGKFISRLFKQLPIYRARDGFEEKMAASFALELKKDSRVAETTA
ncbi:MAG: hypothetical protein WEA56_00685 [Balneolaceae bacterium]